MKVSKKITTALVVFFATAGTSHLMQSTWTVAARDATTPITDVASTSAGMPEAPKQEETLVPASSAEVPADVVPVPLPDATPAPEPAVLALDAAQPEIVPVRLDPNNEEPDPAEPIVVPDMPEDVAGPAPLPTPGPSPLDRLAMTDSNTDPETVTDTPAVNEYGLACGIVVSAAERPAAMVNLTVTAPCRSGERITVRHNGLLYSAALSGLGTYSAEVPALTDYAVFNVTFPDGEIATTEVTVPRANQTERVVLQFNGRTGLQIHALEFGAEYGAPGHVWSGNARDAETAVKMGGGYVTSLGDPSLADAFFAEIYTLPTDVTERDGVVRLNVEAEVNSRNCAKTIAGETLQRTADGKMTAVSLTLSMPECDAIGEFLVLKNLLRDLKIASN